MKSLLLVCAVVLSFAVVAGEEIVKVKGTGTGKTEELALKDAYRDAVERAVGFFVDAEQQVKNEEVINDQVLTQSNAYIEKCKQIKKSESAGLVKVVIVADVRKSALTKRISDLMPTQTVSLGADLTDLHAEINSKEKRDADGAALLKNALRGVDPITMLMKPGIRPDTRQVVKKVNDGDRWFTGGTIPEGKVGLSYVCTFEVDWNRYFKEFVPKLKQILDQISIKPPKSFRVTAVSESAIGERHQWIPKYLKGGENRSAGRHDLEFRGEMCPGYYMPLRVLSGTVAGKSYLWRSCGIDFYHDHAFEAEDRNLETTTLEDYALKDVSSGELVLITELNKDRTSGRAVRYVISLEAVKVLSGWMGACGSYAACCKSDHKNSDVLTYNVVFKDKDGSEVCVFPLKTACRSLMNVGCAQIHGSGNCEGMTVSFYVSPFVGCAGDTLVQWRDFVVKTDDLPKISTVTFELAE